jgi:CDP-6-deoxy-D-xylo-4-hexulose-3-dehydrase
MAGRVFRTIGDLAQADLIMERTFWVGVYPGLGGEQIDFMIEKIQEFCDPKARRGR